MNDLLSIGEMRLGERVGANPKMDPISAVILSEVKNHYVRVYGMETDSSGSWATPNPGSE